MPFFDILVVQSGCNSKITIYSLTGHYTFADLYDYHDGDIALEPTPFVYFSKDLLLLVVQLSAG